MAEEIRSLVEQVVATMQEKSKAMAEAYWNLATTGKAEEGRKAAEAETELRLFLSDRERFARFKAARENPTGDALLDRQVELLYGAYLENQLEKETITDLVNRANEMEQIFGNFRGTIDGKAVSDNEIRDILVKSNDNGERKKAWYASKQIGPEVGPKLVALVKARNQAAQSLGFQNYYEMQLTLSEINPADLFKLLDELKQLTDGPFAAMMEELGAEQAKRFGMTAKELRPWHLADPFFQELPPTGGVDLDPYFAGKSVEELSVAFYDGVGMDVRDIIARSDLYEREGKNQHAFCIDIDREGDVRTLCNLRPTAWWMSTMLHELGHAVYDKYADHALPWLLREPAHINSTEAIAMYFGRLTRDSDWLHRIAGVPEAEAQSLGAALAKEQSRAMLIFVRWVLVMVGFESRLYANPDQDLNRLWWNLVEELQFVTRPEELNGYEWATKIHLTISPVYYHNYLIGELTASHLNAHIARATGTEQIVGNKGVGEWLIQRFFKPGRRYTWNRLVEQATGEALSPKYFVDDFVR